MSSEIVTLRLDRSLVDGFRVAAKKIGVPMQRLFQDGLFWALVGLDTTQPGCVAFKRRGGE